MPSCGVGSGGGGEVGVAVQAGLGVMVGVWVADGVGVKVCVGVWLGVAVCVGVALLAMVGVLAGVTTVDRTLLSVVGELATATASGRSAGSLNKAPATKRSRMNKMKEPSRLCPLLGRASGVVFIKMEDSGAENGRQARLSNA